MSDPTKCALCPEPHDGWPNSPDGDLCQMCWEKKCSDSWWAAVDAGMQVDLIHDRMDGAE